MNYRDYVIDELKNYSRKDIIFTNHTEIRMLRRQINKTDVIENLLNPKRLEYAVKEKSNQNDEKFDCYFGYSKTQCHRYVVVLTRKLIIVTVIKINRRWQIIAQKKLGRKND